MGNKFIVVREDLVQDPVTIITDGLLIGRLQECELLLNHPSVSRVQGGIKQIEGDYYVFGLRPANPVKLNGKAVEENEALGAGDVIEVGPFLLDIERSEGALVIKVSLQIGRSAHRLDASSARVETQKLEDLLKDASAEKKRAAPKRAAPLPGTKALDIFWDKRIREAGKMVRPSPLFPRSQRRTGKGQFNWLPTTDLARRWPVSFFIWGGIVVTLVSVLAAYWYVNAYAPAPVSKAHAQNQLILLPAIAARPNANSCTTCHSLRGSMEANCAACHNADAFVATVIPPHQAAGIGCTTCHAEHQGANFKPAEAALLTCTQCHNDANKQTYGGRRVGTPHGGAFGYPLVNGKWVWKGLSDSDWAAKKIDVLRLATDNDEQWHSKQFHTIHVGRVRAATGMPADARGQLSCSSCHKSHNPPDRETPRQTCGACHNGRIEIATGRALIAADKPNCTSCHVQHVKDKRHWNPSLMANTFSGSSNGTK
jgi:hypothetical protein